MNLPFSRSDSGPGDPSSAYDARPIVAVRGNDRSAWWFGGGLLIAGLLLFMALEARRQGTEQREAPPVYTVGSPEALPELVVPALPSEQSPLLVQTTPLPQPSGARAAAQGNLESTRQRARVMEPYSQPQPGYSGSYEPALPPPSTVGPAYPQPQAEAGPAQIGNAPGGLAARVTAGRLENPSTTVIQGTLINAVLETALDSTRAGQARAVVTRDVYGFDGKKLLVPRGSRLYGNYEADVGFGQNRAQILWTRLLRPDGVSVALDSPVADPLGRAGVRGKVNSHFFQRLGNALIGTAGNIGSALVTRNVASSPVVVAVPGTAQAVQPLAQPQSGEVKPTLTVRQGTRISVFVQHDLDFTSVEGTP